MPQCSPSQSRVTYVEGSSTALSPRRSARITISTTAASGLPAKASSGPLVMTRQSRLISVAAPAGAAIGAGSRRGSVLRSSRVSVVSSWP